MSTSRDVVRTTDELEQAAQRFERDAYAEATRRNYQRDWDAFARWCAERDMCALPAKVETLRRYLAYLAESGRAYSTIRHARSSIGLAHKHADLPRPDDDPRVRMLERGIGRERGGREEGVTPLLEHEVARAVAALGNGPVQSVTGPCSCSGSQARFARPTSPASTWTVIAFCLMAACASGSVDQRRIRSGAARTPTSRLGERPETCPVDALRAWIARVGRPSGPLFRVVRVEHERISTRAVARAVQRATARAGLNGHFAAHSLRSGLATSAYAAGCTEREIQAHGRWKDRRSLDRYIAVERLPKGRNVVDGLL